MAFVGSHGLALKGSVYGTSLDRRIAKSGRASRRRATLRMAEAEKSEAAKEAAEDGQTSKELLAQLKADVESDPLKDTGAFDGRTWDGEGRQNNWAIEPLVSGC